MIIFIMLCFGLILTPQNLRKILIIKKKNTAKK